MQKHELVGITIQQLIEHFKSSPESFEYYDHNCKPAIMNPTICFQPKVQLGDPSSSTVSDPNNGHAIFVSFNNDTELTCYLFLKAPQNLMSSNSSYAADSVMTSSRPFEKWRGNYRKFKQLRNLIMARNKYKENLTYLKKLSVVFPDTMDSHLLDK